MQTIIGLALIAAIAYALLRLLAWLGQAWERGYLFEPASRNAPLQQFGSNDAEQVPALSLDSFPRKDRWSNLDRPCCNFDGTPMLGCYPEIYGRQGVDDSD